jgi:[acyl-carrier-protein] S-malonyltransferase
MKNIAMVFPGQGSQSVGMLHAYSQQFPEVLQTFAEASQALGYNLWNVVQNGPAEKLNQTEITQPALLTASVAIWRIWQSKTKTMPSVMAGHSLGEYSALVCAGAITFNNAVRLVAKRGEFMQAAVPEGVGAMAAIIGLTPEQVADVCRDAAQGEVVQSANFNAPGQIVIAGHVHAVERAMQLAKQMGAKLVKRLDVSVPSHCALMKSAADKLGHLLEDISWQMPATPVIQNVAAESYATLSDIKNALFQQLFSPVRWVETVEKLDKTYATELIIECGTGKVLSGLNKRISNRPTVSLSEPASLIEVLTHV